MVDASTRKTLSSIPLLQTKAGPRDKELWVQRLKEEYQALIKVTLNVHLSASLHIVDQISQISLRFPVRSKQQRFGFGLVSFGIE